MTVNAACNCDVRAMIRVQYTSTDSSARVRNVWGINRVLLRISIWFPCQFAGFHVANRAVIDVCYYCANVLSVLAHFGSEYSRARSSTDMQVRSVHRELVYVAFLVTRSFPHQLFGLNRGCCSVCCSSTADKLSAVSYDPLSHSRHNAEDSSTKVGHELKRCLCTTSMSEKRRDYMLV